MNYISGKKILINDGYWYVIREPREIRTFLFIE